MARATIRHSHGFTFIGMGKSEHWVVMDSSAQTGGDGGASSPKELLLLALGGCTGMDVASTLRKSRQDVRTFVLEVEADEVENPPKVFTEARLVYRVDGPALDAAAVERAVRLSLDKYCSVSAMLRKAFPIAWRVLVNGEEIASGVEGDR
jgi:putative redox protein